MVVGGTVVGGMSVPGGSMVGATVVGGTLVGALPPPGSSLGEAHPAGATVPSMTLSVRTYLEVEWAVVDLKAREVEWVDRSGASASSFFMRAAALHEVESEAAGNVAAAFRATRSRPGRRSTDASADTKPR
jgi:hypothetical protein